MNSQTSYDGEDTPTTTPMESNTATPDVEMRDAAEPEQHVVEDEEEEEEEEGEEEEDDDEEEEEEEEEEADEENADKTATIATQLEEEVDVEVDVEEEEEEDDDETSLALPMSKIKKIFKMDPDYIAASQSAVYATGLATELFIQYFVEQASSLAKRSKRKKITYSDFSDAVKGHDSLIFLKDTIPEKQKLEDLIARNVLDANGHPTETALTVAKGKFDSGDKEADITNKTSSTSDKIRSKGQQTLKFVSVNREVEDKPIKKAVIHDLIANDEPPVTSDVVMID